MAESFSEVHLTEGDRQILESYKKMIDGLADYLGSGYEIVLHSLENFQHSAIRVINGEYTGRKEGAPITDLALAMLSRIRQDHLPGHISYFTENKNGEPLKSATIIIPGTKGTPIGLLCINFYLNTPLSVILEGLTNNRKMEENFLGSSLEEDPESMIRREVEEAKEKVLQDTSVSRSRQKREIIYLLEQKGIFLVKDSVDIVSEMLGISRNTVYLHLRNIRAQSA